MAKSGGGSRKQGRNKIVCQTYRNENRREKSKARRLSKHLGYQPHDEAAKKAYEALPDFVKRMWPLPTEQSEAV